MTGAVVGITARSSGGATRCVGSDTCTSSDTGLFASSQIVTFAVVVKTVVVGEQEFGVLAVR